MTRKITITPDLIQKIVGNIVSGMWGNEAAEAAGVSRTSYTCWRQKGRAALKKKSLNKMEQLHVMFLMETDGAVRKRDKYISQEERRWLRGRRKGSMINHLEIYRIDERNRKTRLSCGLPDCVHMSDSLDEALCPIKKQ